MSKKTPRTTLQKKAIILAIIEHAIADNKERSRLRDLAIRGVTEQRIIEKVGGTSDQMPGENCFYISNSKREGLGEISRISCYLYPVGKKIFYEIRVGQEPSAQNIFSGECANQHTCNSMYRIHHNRVISSF